MPVMSAERIRLTFDVPDRVRRALNIAAARRGVPVGEIIEEMTEECLPDDLSLADRTIAQGAEPPKQKKGRKPKEE